MQKWSPESFDLEAAAQRSPLARTADFQLSNLAGVATVDCDSANRGFRREAGFSDTASLMNSLTAEERSQVYELVEIDLIEGYKAREQALTADYESRLAEANIQIGNRFATWTDRITEAMAVECRDAAAAAGRLAVQIAEKVIRQAVVADPSVLARVIETTMFKIAASAPLTIQANPADVSWLDEQSNLKERLNIGEILADRRVEQGGCVINCAGREWDATLARQIGNLAEIVDEMMANAEVTASYYKDDPARDLSTPETSTESEVDDVPGVE